MAGSPARKTASHDTRRNGRRKQTRRATPRRKAKQPLFHGGSFFTGMLVGIGATVVGALLPGWWEASAIKTPALALDAQGDTVAETRFEFWDRLPRGRGNPDTAAYRKVTPIETNDGTEFLVQAGSFEASDDADRMRASLLLLGLSASTRPVTLEGGTTWHRVLVGPFDSERDSRRTITRLREQNIEPLLLKRVKQG